MTPRQAAGALARIAAYGSATVRTPADYTLLEAIERAEKDAPKLEKKRKRYEKVETVVVDEALGPMFEDALSE